MGLKYLCQQVVKKDERIQRVIVVVIVVIVVVVVLEFDNQIT